MSVGTSSHWTSWLCENCGQTFDLDTKHSKCPGYRDGERWKSCGGRLVRWMRYQVKS
jgi:hypothetical protein